MQFILDELAIGSYEEAQQPPSAIDALLCVAAERDVYPGRCKYHKVPIIDMQPIPVDQMCNAIEWIDAAVPNHRIMVFCNAGIGRSPSVVVGYLCCVLGYSFGEAVELVATRKPYMSILPDLILTIAKAAEQVKISIPEI